MKLYVIDTNVILLAGTTIGELSVDQLNCFEKCILFLDEVISSQAKVLLDDSGLIIDEYRKVFSSNPYPNNGTIFFEYLLGNALYQHIEEIGDYTYKPYPDNKELQSFDKSDRKFIAVAFGYDGTVPIVEATDSKWWGIAEILRRYDMDIIFVDREYIMSKYSKKME